MDPVYYQLATNRKQDNVRRSGDNLYAQKTSEKEKATKAGKLDDSELSADVGGMSGDDLLGSMDPDLFGSGGGTSAFQQTWEEILNEEDEEEPPDHEEEGEGQQQPPQDEVQEEEGRKPLKEFELTAPVQAEKVEMPPAASGARPTGVSAEDGMREPPAPEEPPAQKAPPPLEPVKIKIDAPTFSSLLDLTGGFLIAEETLPELSDEDEPLPDAAEEEAEAVAPELVDLLARLIVGDSSSPGFRKLQGLLGRFGRGVLRTCVEQEAKVYLLPRGSGLSSHPLVANSGLKDVQGAVYLTHSRSCVVEEECLLAAPEGFHPVLFYFAHAFDHALGGEDFASLRSPAVQASYQASQFSGQLIDPLAGASPVHYFAQAVESYLNENDSLDPLWTRFDLYDFDRSMFEYVDYLFKRANK